MQDMEIYSVFLSSLKSHDVYIRCNKYKGSNSNFSLFIRRWYFSDLRNVTVVKCKPLFKSILVNSESILSKALHF